MQGGVHVVIASHFGPYGDLRSGTLVWAIESLRVMKSQPDTIWVSLSSNPEHEFRASEFGRRAAQTGPNVITRRRPGQVSQCRHILDVLLELETHDSPPEWIMFLDDDDLASPELLTTYDRVIAERKDLDLLFCYSYINGPETTAAAAQNWESLAAGPEKNRIHECADHSGSLWRRAALLEAFRCLEDPESRSSKIAVDSGAGDCILRAWGTASAKSTTVCAPLVFRRQWRDCEESLEKVRQAMAL